MERCCGILMAVSSLPSPHGIGTFGKAAYDFIDFLRKAGQKCWQVLPLGPVGYGDSPYQSFSTFAGNPYYIDLELLAEEGLVSPEMLGSLDWGGMDGKVDYEKIYDNRFAVLKAACLSRGDKEKAAAAAFAERNHEWVYDYALYMALKQLFCMKSWTEWPDEAIRRRDGDRMGYYWHRLKDQIDCWIYIQYLFFRQWDELKRYANKSGIRIIGDLPIYAAMDSVDVWSHKDLFQLDEACAPVCVAGCPPDYFSECGQLWGNPVYRWERHKETGYAWWRGRLSASLRMFDILRIDHFRGFEAYYKISAGQATAKKGIWEKGPGIELFKAVSDVIGEGHIIAEDLGHMTAEVKKLLKDTGFPGMKVLQFAFEPKDSSDYLPHNHTANCVVYTGTHDNTTAAGWFREAKPGEIAFAKKYLALSENEGLHWGLIRGAYGSVANMAIVQMQDILGLDESARMNTPSTMGGNWQWRLDSGLVTSELCRRLKELAVMYGR